MGSMSARSHFGSSSWSRDSLASFEDHVDDRRVRCGWLGRRGRHDDADDGVDERDAEHDYADGGADADDAGDAAAGDGRAVGPGAGGAPPRAGGPGAGGRAPRAGPIVQEREVQVPKIEYVEKIVEG